VDSTAEYSILKFGEYRFITLGDDVSALLVWSEGVVATERDRRVLIAVAPPLLGDLLARELDRSDLEVVVLDDARVLHGDLRFDVVIATGLPPARVHATTVVQLPDRVRGNDLGSLLTADGIERIRLTGLAGVVEVIDKLCPREPRPE
jgi:hypothetical protein